MADKRGSTVLLKLYNKYRLILFVDVMDDIYKNDDYWNIGLSDDIYEIIMKNKDRLNEAINYENDYIFDYFGLKVILYYYVVYIVFIHIYFRYIHININN